MHFYPSFYSSTPPIPPPPAPLPALHFPITPSAPANYGYHPEPVNINSWPWAPAGPAPAGIAAGGPASYFMPGIPHPVPAPHLTGMYYQPQPHLPFGGDVSGHVKTRDALPYESGYVQPGQHLAYHQQYPEFISSSSSSAAFRPPSPPAHTRNILHAPRLSESPEPSQATLHPSAQSNAGGALVFPPERNQLNIASIEDGLDTRTTVMVKNIPNKMSDRDLIAYIGNVCPRKIDFLYLRMDFQNGKLSFRASYI
jgi:hypothetical protein